MYPHVHCTCTSSLCKLNQKYNGTSVYPLKVREINPRCVYGENTMAGIRDPAKQCFPLQEIKSVVSLFRSELTDTSEPNLAMLSIVAGMIENVLTSNRGASSAAGEAVGAVNNTVGIEPIFPVVELPNVEALYCKFETQIKGSVDLSDYKPGYATRSLIKKVSDIVWSSLTRSYYKEKAHLQSLFSLLTGE